MSDEPVQPDPNDATDVAEPLSIAFDGGTDVVVMCENDEEGQKGRGGDECDGPEPALPPMLPGDATLIVSGVKYPIPCQDNEWDLPAALRQLSLATLWSIVRSRRQPALTKIRAIETLVRVDQQALASERQEDWRSIQSSNSNRSNIRVLAEMNRNKSQAKSLPKPRKP